MYSWDGDTSTWYGTGKYKYRSTGAGAREEAAERAKSYGARTYEGKNQPNMKIIDPHKHICSESKNPLIIGIDVTGSMSTWPFEIFDRLPLLYSTLSQYREDLEICFAAIGDSSFDKWPLQVTTFANGFDLDQLLSGIYGEGGGGDAPESYGLFAHWINTHVSAPNTTEQPFLIIFGDTTMHRDVPKEEIQQWLGDSVPNNVDSLRAWQQVTQNWNTWFLRRPTGRADDLVDQMWAKAIGQKKIFHLKDEQRAVDYTMGLIARAWGFFDDFQENMRARQSVDQVDQLSKLIEMVCPRCGAPIPVDANGMFSCKYCGTTLKI